MLKFKKLLSIPKKYLILIPIALLFGVSLYKVVDRIQNPRKYRSYNIIKEIDPLRPVTLNLVKELIATEIPKNTKKDQVIQFLSKHKIDNYECGKSGDGKYFITLEDNPGINPSEIEYCLTGRIPRIAQDPVFVWRIEINFFFDKDNKLIQYQVLQLGKSSFG